MANELILWESTSTDWTLKAWRDNGLMAEIQFKEVNKVLRAIRRYWTRWGFPFQQIWYADWKNIAKKADIVIVHISDSNLFLPQYINRLNPNARVIAWYWNTIDKKSLPKDIKGRHELWSFDAADCKNFGMNFNHQYYFKTLSIKGKEPEWDIYFVGQDKGRSEAIIYLWQELRQLNIKSLFQVVRPKKKTIPDEIISPYLSYDTIRENISKSRAILEIVKSGQTGATLRMMEAMFFQKKLITNNPAVKDEPFYDPQNIFIIGERPIEEIRNFIDEPMKLYDQNTIDLYDVKQWFANFVNNISSIK